MNSNVYKLPPQPPRDKSRFNEAARAFFEHWRPAAERRGGVPAPKVLVRFDFSKNGYLVAHYLDPVSRRIEIWGLDAQQLNAGKVTPIRLKS